MKTLLNKIIVNFALRRYVFLSCKYLASFLDSPDEFNYPINGNAAANIVVGHAL